MTKHQCRKKSEARREGRRGPPHHSWERGCPHPLQGAAGAPTGGPLFRDVCRRWHDPSSRVPPLASCCLPVPPPPAVLFLGMSADDGAIGLRVYPHWRSFLGARVSSPGLSIWVMSFASPCRR